MHARWFALSLVCLAADLGSARAPAQFEPPPNQKVDAATLKEVAAKTAQLGDILAKLRQRGGSDLALADVEVYHKAAVWIVRHGEFYTADAGKQTLEVLDRGLFRANQLNQGKPVWLDERGQDTVRGYRSRVDDSVQPYSVNLPTDYGKDPAKRWRLDVFLHGRDASLTEVKFLFQRLTSKAKAEDFIRLDIFGRTNNAYRWAGEADVFEAIQNFIETERKQGRDLVDPQRVVLRGFSMGGAGTWHLGLHHPDRWCVLGPGAGFSTTHGYIKGLPKLPDYQEKCLRIYDAVDYAENAFNVPIVAYSGDQDPQKAAADNIEAALKKLGLPMTHIIAPGLGHSFPVEWQQKAFAEYAKHAGPGRKEYPDPVRFVTYTLKYPRCDWVELHGLEKHYEQARVEAVRTNAAFTVKTANVNRLRLRLPANPPGSLRIDGQEVSAKPQENRPALYLEKRDGKWQAVSPKAWAEEPRKAPGLTGPIDDAFTGPFICVRGTGKPWHDAAQKTADARLDQFAADWNKFLRGDLPIRKDTEVTADDIADKHLILFGDPASNSLIAKILPRLPLKWGQDSVALAGLTGSSANHLPVLIQPNPLNPKQYVVLNSGHTFSAADFRGTNALLYPRLGDYALLKVADGKPAEVVGAGLFDEQWRVK